MIEGMNSDSNFDRSSDADRIGRLVAFRLGLLGLDILVGIAKCLESSFIPGHHPIRTSNLYRGPDQRPHQSNKLSSRQF